MIAPKRRRNFFGIMLFAVSSFVLPSVVLAAVDAPSKVIFDFLATDDDAYRSFEDVPGDAPFYTAESSEAYASSDASDFDANGVLLFAGFILDAPDGQRYGMLFVDMDLAAVPDDVDVPFPKSALKAWYLEMRGDDVVFRGTMATGDVWIVDWFVSNDDKGGLDGDFAFIFKGQDGGCRVLERGMFITRPSPSALRGTTGGGDDRVRDGQEYTSVGCDGDVLFVGDSGGCGGEDPSDGSSGCEGDTSSSSGGCEGDTSNGSDGCEGESSGSVGCDDTSDDGACSGSQANAATLSGGTHRHKGGIIGAVMRMFPELTAFAFLVWMKRRVK